MIETDKSPTFQKLPAGRGRKWFSLAYENFSRQPGMWILLNILVVIFSIGFSQAPLIGGLIMGVLGLYFKMGLLLGAEDVKNGKPLEFEHLFKAFRREFLSLLWVDLFSSFMLLLAIACCILIFILVLGQGDMMTTVHKIQTLEGKEKVTEILLLLTRSLGAIWAALLVGALVALPAFLATFFAPYLIVFRKSPVGEALKVSFRAASANVWPLTVYGLLGILFSLGTLFTLGLGMLVLIPVMNIAYYYSCTEIFVTDNEASTT